MKKAKQGGTPQHNFGPNWPEVNRVWGNPNKPFPWSFCGHGNIACGLASVLTLALLAV